MVLSLTVEWGVGMERQGPSYGEVVTQEIYEFRPFSEEVKALCLGARRRSSGLCVYELQGAEPLYLWRGVAYIECARTPASPRNEGFKVYLVRGVTGTVPHKVS